MLPSDVKSSPLILDGALATELERMGYDLNHPYWSGSLLQSHPEAIQTVHKTYLDVGAEILTTATYQLPFTEKELLTKALKLANKVRQESKKEPCLIACSIGSYGSFLGAGAEYRGDYQTSQEELERFHEPKISLLLNLRESSKDLSFDFFLCETIPSLPEALALISLFKKLSFRDYLLSFSLRSQREISDGTPLEDLFEELRRRGVFQIGFNCYPPEWSKDLASSVPTDFTFGVYPNSGERFNPISKNWTSESSHAPNRNWIEDLKPILLDSRLRWVGGCCRTTPLEIQELIKQIGGSQASKAPD